MRLSRTDWVAIGLLALALIVRCWQLGADPPLDLSSSTDVYTDTAQYTLFARNRILFGEYDPFHDTRYPLFINSAVTPVATAIFRLVGSGVWQSNAVGLLFAFGSLVTCWWFVRKCFGQSTALVFLLLTVFDYNLLFYGRLTFLEHVMTFFAFVSLTFLGDKPGVLRWFLGGLSLAAAICFGKMLAVIFLFPFACFIPVWLTNAEQMPFRSKRKAVLSFLLGFGLLCLLWALVVYCPLSGETLAYVKEQSVGLYGPPQGLRSLDDFVYQTVTFGMTSRLFGRMLVSSLLVVGLLMGLSFFPHLWREKFHNHPLSTAGTVFLVASAVAFYGSLMIWNYRPLRYQLPLIYVLHGLAAVALAALWNRRRRPVEHSPANRGILLILPVLLIVVYQLAAGWADWRGWPFFYADEKYWIAGVTIAAAVGIRLFLSAPWFKRVGSSTLLRRAIVLVAVIGIVYPGIRNYARWTTHPTFTAADVSRDLGRVLAPNAVLSGPYAASLVRENQLQAVIHMFGVSHRDSALFVKLPITHLVMDFANEKRAKEDYPAVMSAAVRLCDYHVGDQTVTLYRIAGATGNNVADSYVPSPTEDILVSLAYTKTLPDTADEASIALNTALARQDEGNCNYLRAELLLQKAVEFSPTSYVLSGELARLYRQWYMSTGDNGYRQLAESWYERALKLNPDDAPLRGELFELRDTPE